MIDEGYIKFESKWQRTEPLDFPDIDDLIKWRRPLYAAGLIGHYEDLGIGYGNISLRMPGAAGSSSVVRKPAISPISATNILRS